MAPHVTPIPATTQPTAQEIITPIPTQLLRNINKNECFNLITQTLQQTIQALSLLVEQISYLNISDLPTHHYQKKNRVEFREELLTSTPKHSSHPELLRQLALEVINDIPDQALIIYTDGTRSDTGRAGSGIFSNTPGNDVKISIRNPDPVPSLDRNS
ncbi:RNase H domain-containing protein [Trichonephila clavipes]|nr:RNase H domain-containing protein [Trichonephila clavipes]